MNDKTNKNGRIYTTELEKLDKFVVKTMLYAENKCGKISNKTFSRTILYQKKIVKYSKKRKFYKKCTASKIICKN